MEIILEGNSMIDIDELKRHKVISFDIFDTLLSRNYINPKDVFEEMQNQVKEKFSDFAAQRVKAELECRRQYNFGKEVTLKEIYGFLLDQKYIDGLGKNDIDELIKLELQIEKNNLFANHEIKSLIDTLKQLNKQVILVSDIYLSKQFLQEVLANLGIQFDDKDLYVSSELGVMKSNKKLFEYVLKDLSLKPNDLYHIGDNKTSDYDNPKSLGIHAFHYTKAIPNRYERQDNFTSIKLSRLRALSRKTRLANPFENDNHKATIWDTTANVSAPLMTGFTLWCLQKTKELGIDKIYFCSRDGEVLYKIAKELLPVLDLDIKIDYLHVSRQSLLFPSIKEINPESLEWIMAPTAVLTPRIILKRINFEPEEISDMLKQHGLYNKLDQHLKPEERQAFRKMLKEMESLIVARAKEYRTHTKAYLKQKGLYEGRFALVDIGWSGTLQRSISQFLGEDGYAHPTYGLYFGVKRRKKFKDEDQLHGWFTDHRSPRGLDKKTYIIPMTELFTAALHGGVHSHRMTDGVYGPKLLKETNETGLKWGVDVQHEAMVSFANRLATMPFLLKNFMQHQELDYLEHNYEKLLLSPSLHEAQTYGAYEDAEDQNESYHVKLAQPYTLLEQIKMVFKENYRHHHNEWQEGALKLTKYNLNKQFIKKQTSFESSTKKIIFLHIPKCGGMSLRKELAANFQNEQVYTISGWNHDEMVKSVSNLKEQIWKKNIKLIMGHIGLGIHKGLTLNDSEIIYISVMREPIERVVSLYKYIKQEARHELHMKCKELDFGTFIRLPEIRDQISNVQYNHLINNPELDFELIEKTFSNLIDNKQLIVGTLENYNQIINIFNKEFGFNLKNIAVNESKKQNVQINDEDVSFLKELNSKEYILYNYLREKGL